MKALRFFYLSIFLLSGCTMTQMHVEFKWDTLKSLPDTTGFAGSFAGISNNALLVVGGSNFPDNGAPWKGSTKVWYDNIFVLKHPDGEWHQAGVLPITLGYGVSVSTRQGLVCVGGSNDTGHVAKAFLLNYKQDSVVVENFSDLPFALANTCGALVNNKIYIAGGIRNPHSRETENSFFCLDLSKEERSWQQLASWPGQSRMLSVAAEANGKFYLIGGTELIDGKRVYLKDSYSYDEKEGWKRLADLPYPVVAAPSPAYSNGNFLYVFGGDDGKLASSDLKEKHPGFSDNILVYDIKNDAWNVSGKIYTDIKENAVEVPNESVWAPVTTTMALWNNKIVIPGGEVRPATRTPKVLSAEIIK